MTRSRRRWSRYWPTVDGRYVAGAAELRSVAFTGSTLTISPDGLTVTLVLGTPDDPALLRAVDDPVVPVITVTDQAPRDLAGLPLAPGVLGGTGPF